MAGVGTVGLPFVAGSEVRPSDEYRGGVVLCSSTLPSATSRRTAVRNAVVGSPPVASLANPRIVTGSGASASADRISAAFDPSSTGSVPPVRSARTYRAGCSPICRTWPA